MNRFVRGALIIAALLSMTLAGSAEARPTQLNQTWTRVTRTLSRPITRLKANVARWATRASMKRHVTLLPGGVGYGTAGNTFVVSQAKTKAKVKAPSKTVKKAAPPMKVAPGPLYGYAGTIYIR